MANSMTSDSSDSLLRIESDADKPDRHLRYFTFFAALSQVFGLIMIFLTAYLNGTYFDGYTWGNVMLPPLLPTATGMRPSNGNLNYHATFMTFGFVFLQGEAILMYRMFRHESKMFSKVLHGVFHLFAFILIVFGLVAIVMHKNLRKMGHIYSAHSWVGVTLITLFIFQFLIGFVNFFFPKTSPSVRAWFLPVHKGVGLMVFGIASAQALGGQWARSEIYQLAVFSHRSFNNGDINGPIIGYNDCYGSLSCKGPEYIENFATIFLILYSVSVIFIVGNSDFARRKTPDEEQ